MNRVLTGGQAAIRVVAEDNGHSDYEDYYLEFEDGSRMFVGRCSAVHLYADLRAAGLRLSVEVREAVDDWVDQFERELTVGIAEWQDTVDTTAHEPT